MQKKQYFEKGFSYLELLIVLGIFTMITSTLLINYNTFDSRIAVENKAHEIAQWIREAQAYAMGVKSEEGQSWQVTRQRNYGIHFDMNNIGSFVMFTDRGVYDMHYDTTENIALCDDASVECVKHVTLPNSMKISKLSVDAGNAQAIDIVFKRPDPDAYIACDVGAGMVDNCTNAKIELTSVKGYKRQIVVLSSGQISIQSVP